MDARDPFANERDDRLAEELGRVLADPASASVEHPDDPTLAAYLDRRLGVAEARVIEEHLEGCRDCRELALEAALALAPPIRRSAVEAQAGPPAATAKRWPRGSGRRWLAAAAVITLVALGALLARQPVGGGRPGVRLAELGVEAELLAAIDPELAAAAAEAARGRWPSSKAFEPYRLEAGGSALRAGSGAAAPEPLAPRWSAVRSPRPRFRWADPQSEAGDYEIFVVDDTEALAAKWNPRSEQDRGTTMAEYPLELPALEPGRVYFWKLNARVAGEPVASAYVPFRVLSAGEEERLAGELAGAAGSDFLRAVILARRDLRGEALAALARMPGRRVRAERLGRALAAGSRLSPPRIEEELDRAFAAAGGGEDPP